MENQMEKKMENEMDIGVIYGFIGIITYIKAPYSLYNYRVW